MTTLMNVFSSFVLLLLGFCFIIAAVVSLTTVVSHIASVNVNDAFNFGAEIAKMTVKMLPVLAGST